MTPHTCNPSVGPFVGYQPLGDGDVAELRNCACGSTRATHVHTDATVCAVCGEIVTGEFYDPKLCVIDAAEGAIVLHSRCFRRDPRRGDWLRWDDDVMGPASRPMLVDTP
jgi:hypothetical protein